MIVRMILEICYRIAIEIGIKVADAVYYALMKKLNELKAA